MDVKNIDIKGIPSSEFNDNEYLENYVKELEANGVNVVLSKLDDMINWGRSNSIWPLIYATSCCGIEFMSTAAAHHDISRFGMEVTRNSPRQADLMIVAGTMVHKMAPLIKRVYDQMAEPKYVIAMGACAISGGPFVNSYHVVNGVDQIIPVDVYIPGCPPRPEQVINGIMKIQDLIGNEHLRRRNQQEYKELLNKYGIA